MSKIVTPNKLPVRMAIAKIYCWRKKRIESYRNKVHIGYLLIRFTSMRYVPKHESFATTLDPHTHVINYLRRTFACVIFDHQLNSKRLANRLWQRVVGCETKVKRWKFQFRLFLKFGWWSCGFHIILRHTLQSPFSTAKKLASVQRNFTFRTNSSNFN